MTTLEAPVAAHGVLTDPTTLTLQRRLPGPVQRVWAYLTDSALRRQWLAAGGMKGQPDTDFELVWRNDELSASAAERPDGMSAESRANCRLLEVEPLRRLRFDWPGAGEVTFELEPDGPNVLLTVTHRRLDSRPLMVMVGAGWHAHLDILSARVHGTAAPSFWSSWLRLRADYELRLPA